MVWVMKILGRRYSRRADPVPLAAGCRRHGRVYLIHNRDPLFTAAFDRLLRSVWVEPVTLPSRSLNLNAFAERFVLHIKSVILSRLTYQSL